MIFKLCFNNNPFKPTPVYYSQKGNYLLNQYKIKLKRLFFKHDKRINIISTCKEGIKGLSVIYNFNKRKFINDNIKHTKTGYWVLLNNHKHKLTIPKWIKLVNDLNKECYTIRNLKNVSSLIRSKYNKYIILKGVQHYYHPIKKTFVKNVRIKMNDFNPKKRYIFAGNFARFGSKPNGQLTILLLNVFYKNTKITDHLWMNATKAFKQLGHINLGDIIVFKARVKIYKKGYLPHSFRKLYDYELVYPTHVKRIPV